MYFGKAMLVQGGGGGYCSRLTPPFLFLHRRRVVVGKTLRIHTASTFAQSPDRGAAPVP